MKQTIHERISMLRKKKALTQEQLGTKLGITGQAVSKWEKGESLPDLLLLPELCVLLGTTADALLGMPEEKRQADIKKDFYACAAENGPAAAVLEAFDVPFSATERTLQRENILLAVRPGMGFAANKKACEDCMQVPEECVGYAMRILENPGCRALLRKISADRAVTRQELGEMLGIDEDAVNRILMGFMKRGIVVCGKDAQGKRGYLTGDNFVAACMVLAGSLFLGAS